MPVKRVLYVCFDTALLVGREGLLISSGYDVVTVLGLDGLMSQRQISAYDVVLIDERAAIEKRAMAVNWLRESGPALPVIALCSADEDRLQADCEVSPVAGNAWLDSVADCIERRRNTA